MNDRETLWRAIGIVVVLTAIFMSGALTTAGVTAAHCDRYGRTIIVLTAYTCEREQRSGD